MIQAMILGQPRIDGALAQLVARYIRIVEVTGSNPVCSTTPNGIVETGNPVFCIFSNDFTADSP